MFIAVKVTINVYTQVFGNSEGFTSFPSNITGGKVDVLLVSCGTPTKMSFEHEKCCQQLCDLHPHDSRGIKTHRMILAWKWGYILNHLYSVLYVNISSPNCKNSFTLALHTLLTGNCDHVTESMKARPNLIFFKFYLLNKSTLQYLQLCT